MNSKAGTTAQLQTASFSSCDCISDDKMTVFVVRWQPGLIIYWLYLWTIAVFQRSYLSLPTGGALSQVHDAFEGRMSVNEINTEHFIEISCECSFLFTHTDHDIACYLRNVSLFIHVCYNFLLLVREIPLIFCNEANLLHHNCYHLYVKKSDLLIHHHWKVSVFFFYIFFVYIIIEQEHIKLIKRDNDFYNLTTSSKLLIINVS